MAFLDDTGVEYLVADIKEKTDAAYLPIDSLPAVTSSDNGKFLRVENGAWAAVTVPDANGVSF